MPIYIPPLSNKWMLLWIQWHNESQGLHPFPLLPCLCDLLLVPSWALGSSQQTIGHEDSLQLWNNSNSFQPHPTAKVLRLQAAEKKSFWMPLLCLSSLVWHFVCSWGPLYDCSASISWLISMLIAKLPTYMLVILILGQMPRVALTMGCWHHLPVIVWFAIDMSGFRRMHNLIIRPHLQSNHESHYGAKCK